MEARLWGTRGSVPAPGPDTTRYGGNTACVEVRGGNGTVLALDAGTGIRGLGATLSSPEARVDLLLTHLHMDHIQGLGFFAPLYVPGREVHIWGPAGPTLSLRERLSRYMSPPLFPVLLRDLPCTLELHEVPCGEAVIGEFRVTAQRVCHPGSTVGYRITDGSSVLAYLCDHEPALGAQRFPLSPDWTSGFDLAAGANLLIHDAQYTADEYAERVGWGHSSIDDALAFADLAGARHLVLFHHDPAHGDEMLDRVTEEALARHPMRAEVSIAAEGAVFHLRDGAVGCGR